MKTIASRFSFLILASLIHVNTYAYDIEIENEDGIIIYYNYINDGKELQVTARHFVSYDSDGNPTGGKTSRRICSTGYKDVDILRIPSEVTYMGRTRKVTGIDDYTFANYKQFFPQYVPLVGKSDNNISCMYIPSTIKSIGTNAFKNQVYGDERESTIRRIVVDDISNWSTLNLGYNTGFELYLNDSPVTNVLLSDEVIVIGEYSFYKCQSLVSVIMSKSVEEIGFSSFKQCPNLSEIIIGDNVTIIGMEAFRDCIKLETIKIPDNVKQIGYAAFLGCPVSTLFLGNSVEYIDNSAFSDCKLSSLVLPNSVKFIGEGAFSYNKITSITSLIQEPFAMKEKAFDKNTLYNATLYVPKGTIDKYKTTEGWKDFLYIEECSDETDMKHIIICEEMEVYSLNGEKKRKPSKGINIIRMANGTTKKIIK